MALLHLIEAIRVELSEKPALRPRGSDDLELPEEHRLQLREGSKPGL